MKNIFLFLTIMLCALTNVLADNKKHILIDSVDSEITTLTKMVKIAKKKGISTLKEECAIQTAKIFMRYAQWDDVNIDKNTIYFEKVKRYTNEAEKYAKLLPNFERSEVLAMLTD